LAVLLGLILFYVSVTGAHTKGAKNGTAKGLRLAGQSDVHKKEKLLLSTKGHGDIHIVLRPDLSSESVAYIHEMASSKTCPNCNFYRADQRILQGIMKSPAVPKVETKGNCPVEYRGKSQPVCPKHDPDCGCHGPTMTKGMVGWAGGGTGPDFFIDAFEKPAEFWGQEHTVWGEIQDAESLAVVDAIFKLPTHTDGMVFLDEKISFELQVI